MQCYQPYIVKHSETQQSEYPCGRCLACRQLRARDWAQRIKYELENKSKIGDFVTLTTDDEKAVGTQGILLEKDELQRFFKRVRKHHELKYYACGEYGEKHGRAHYHALIIRSSLKDIDYTNYWTQGAIYVGAVTDASIAYCTGYLLKKNAVPSWVPKNHGPFHIWSRGIGDDFMRGKKFLEMAREGNIPRRWRALADENEIPAEEYKRPRDWITGWQRYGRKQEQRAYRDRT